MLAGSAYALIDEMLQAPDILRRFAAPAFLPWVAKAASRKAVFFTGEGSSRIFPAKNAIAQGLARGLRWRLQTEGARQAAEYPLADFFVAGASNSGRTRELVALFEKLKSEGIATYGITPAAQSPLTVAAGETHIISCGAEKAVAATKSVVEQALCWQALLGGNEWAQQAQAADAADAVLAQDIPAGVIEALCDAPVVYFAGRNDGVAEELALKTNEIARKKSAFLEGTYALHGIEEVMQPGEAVILINPFKSEMEKYTAVLQPVGVKIIAVTAGDSPFPTVRVPQVAGFDGYLQLMAGWNMLAACGLALGIDLDRPTRARKVGNAV